jgi:serine/threonine-protein kinase
MSADPEYVGRYRIERVLGRGAMGVVYRAHDPDIDRLVAIKLIRADLLDVGDRSDYLLRFRREAQAAGRCSHPNIVTIYDFATHEGNPFLAMELVDGISLTQARGHGAVFRPEDAARVVLQVLDALATAHALGIVHRDIKPANILLVGGSRVKVTDFGVCRLDSSALTHEGSVIGTPSYMSPEQCRGDPVDQRSDLFSTGAVLYELICGERPFTGRNFAEVAHRLLHEAPPDICARGAGVSAAMKSVLDRALAKSPNERFTSAAEMAAALQSVVAGSPATAGNVLADHTIIVPRADAAATELSGIFDMGVRGTLERLLARHVGPIARYLVQNAVTRSEDMEALCTSLARHIESPAEREAFRTAALRHLQSPTNGASHDPGVPPAITPEELEQAQKELARYIGPMARVLVRRDAAVATSRAELWLHLSRHLDRDADRQAFLARRQP